MRRTRLGDDQRKKIATRSGDRSHDIYPLDRVHDPLVRRDTYYFTANVSYSDEDRAPFGICHSNEQARQMLRLRKLKLVIESGPSSRERSILLILRNRLLIDCQSISLVSVLKWQKLARNYPDRARKVLRCLAQFSTRISKDDFSGQALV